MLRAGSRVAKVNRGPSLMGSTSGNESEIQSLVEKVQKRATEPRRLAQACAQFGRSRTQTARTGRGGDLVRSLTCVRPSNMPSLAGEYQDRQTEGGRHRVARNQTPRVRGQRETEAHRERVRRRRGVVPIDDPPLIAFCSRGARISAGGSAVPRKTSGVLLRRGERGALTR